MNVILALFLAMFCGGNVALAVNKEQVVSELNNNIYRAKVRVLGQIEDLDVLLENNDEVYTRSEERSENKLYNIFYLFNAIALFLVASAGVFYLRYVRGLRRTVKQFMESAEDLEEQGNEEDSTEEKRYITEEKEQDILHKITHFEKEQGYLDKDISLNVLAGSIGVNHRYLSYVINKNKECDFATYVNELRIGYIVSCLKQDPKFLKYKISYLAEQCGFASHSRFTVTFKKVTGDSPSVFISKLKAKDTA
ncbi:AraC family transcriptional regulator [Myroides odoratimimus]|uniref:helix-turn-helix domain-containing protein n=1 Tax=Myroides odoratimimus TaxID=76832 RepID=UPI0024C07D31|nr:AraC family transcriptional regulator [Myroides odoratimimus]WHT72385.1 AraC family transcriptional regulator [Myroides odoratimimus]WHU36968.1 AraC family transcriptional regulator [Myroides odoratimimus]